MTEIQEKLLDMISWLHELCEKESLRYYLLGGTMLGAARHRGFIPWDDDIDIGMPREDYEKLEIILKKEKSSKYILETPNTEAQDFLYPYSKLYDIETTLIENSKTKIKRGIFIDIFPLDGLADTSEECKKVYKKIQWKRNVLLAKTCNIRRGRLFAKNLVVVLGWLLPVNARKIINDLTLECKRRDFDNSEYGGNLLGAWMYKEVMPRRIMGTPKLYDFETIKLYGVEYADEYLKRIYGDWRKLPPKENQITHHDFIYYDLNKSWLD